MHGFVDLHSHWVAGVDDGAQSLEDSLALLRALGEIGFAHVTATPHMRPGMFENTAPELRAAYERTCAALASAPGLPTLGLGSEHFFDDVVFGRLVGGQGLPYASGKAALVELPTTKIPARLDHRFADLRARGIRPVLAHPERYEPVWKDVTVLDPVADGGALLLLDVASLTGKYGRAPKRAAYELLEGGYFYAACSDAHKARDAAEVASGVRLLIDAIGKEEAAFLMIDGPRSILEDRIED